MNYQTVYDFSEEPIQLVWFAPLLFLFIGIGNLIYNFRGRKKNPQFKHVFIVGGVLFTVIGGLASLTIPMLLNRHMDLKSEYANKQFKTIEGVVSGFKQSSPNGNGRDEFSVDSLTFNYSNYNHGTGFCQIASKNGPINRNGLQVRVGYIKKGNELLILKLEIAR